MSNNDLSFIEKNLNNNVLPLKSNLDIAGKISRLEEG